MVVFGMFSFSFSITMLSSINIKISPCFHDVYCFRLLSMKQWKHQVVPIYKEENMSFTFINDKFTIASIFTFYFWENISVALTK